MTYSDLRFFESEVIALVGKVLDAVKEKNFEDYVLLLARGGYQYENEGTFLSPYVVSSQQEGYLDRTRDIFLVTYLNAYANLLKDCIFMTNGYKEYDLNIQMMIYAQIWESHQFLKTLKRIGGILTGRPYEWKISFEYVNEKGKTKSFPKGKMMEDHILALLNYGHPEFARFIEGIYDGQLRNDFAHASYYISLDDNAILSLDSERYLVKKSTNLFEWEQMFINSVLLSYHLPHLIRERCNSFKKDYPEMDYVETDWPSFNEPGRILRVRIKPEERNGEVEFSFVKQR